jgi:hypothetical protein
VRNFAVQTRQATVLEIDDGEVWINVLDGPTCWSDLKIKGRCKHNLGLDATSDRTNKFNLEADDYLDAGAFLCGVEYAALTDSGCTLSTLGAGASFALCYSATGDLYVRPEADANTDCSVELDSVAGDDLAGRGDWDRACTYLAEGEVPLNGAVIGFNRFEEAPSACDSSGALDVKRAVHVPVGSAPFGKVSP